MASGRSQRYEHKKVRMIRELFRGRFSDTEAALLLDINNGDPQATVTYIFNNDPRDVRQAAEREQQAAEAIRRVKQNTSQTFLDRAKSGRIDTEGDLFACGHCDKYWWRRTPQRKPVSKCFSCGRRYDVVPRDKWWGWAEFDCAQCGNQFHGWCHMQVSSPCYHCRFLVKPTRIIPPKKQPRRQNRSGFKHSCTECAPYFVAGGRGGNRVPVHYNQRPAGRKCRCAHPPTRRALCLPAVIDVSTEHDSSGSTVDTFLPQGDLNARYAEFDDLESIAEVSDTSQDE